MVKIKIIASCMDIDPNSSTLYYYYYYYGLLFIYLNVRKRVNSKFLNCDSDKLSIFQLGGKRS